LGFKNLFNFNFPGTKIESKKEVAKPSTPAPATPAPSVKDLTSEKPVVEKTEKGKTFQVGLALFMSLIVLGFQSVEDDDNTLKDVGTKMPHFDIPS
jgi:hypothetical protein